MLWRHINRCIRICSHFYSYTSKWFAPFKQTIRNRWLLSLLCFACLFMFFFSFFFCVALFISLFHWFPSSAPFCLLSDYISNLVEIANFPHIYIYYSQRGYLPPTVACLSYTSIKTTTNFRKRWKKCDAKLKYGPFYLHSCVCTKTVFFYLLTVVQRYDVSTEKISFKWHLAFFWVSFMTLSMTTFITGRFFSTMLIFFVFFCSLPFDVLHKRSTASISVPWWLFSFATTNDYLFCSLRLLFFKLYINVHFITWFNFFSEATFLPHLLDITVSINDFTEQNVIFQSARHLWNKISIFLDIGMERTMKI